MIDQIELHLSILRKTKPLIMNLTNYVTMDFIANCLLALGSSPIMSEDIREIEELVQVSSAININIGTLNPRFMESVKFTCEMANKHQKPIILDPVGAGASKIRIEAVQEILPFIDILRGNASEVMAVYDLHSKSLGVETNHKVSDAIKAARELALSQKITVIVSGAKDFITDGSKERILNFGSNLMPLITGTGCCLTAVIAAFRAVIPNSFEAAKLATSYFGLSGQIAANSAKGPGSFRVELLDNIHQPNWQKMRELNA